jgi:hypothetical protein
LLELASLLDLNCRKVPIRSVLDAINPNEHVFLEFCATNAWERLVHTIITSNKTLHVCRFIRRIKDFLWEDWWGGDMNIVQSSLRCNLQFYIYYMIARSTWCPSFENTTTLA